MYANPILFHGEFARRLLRQAAFTCGYHLLYADDVEIVCTYCLSVRKENSMAAYFVVDIQEITDQQLYAEYRKGVSATLEQYGGKFLVRGGAYETIEGDWQSSRLVIVEFADVE